MTVLFLLLHHAAKETLHSRRIWQCNQETSSCSTLSHRNIHKTKISGINNVSFTITIKMQTKANAEIFTQTDNNSSCYLSRPHREINRRMTDEQAKKTFDRSVKLEQEFIEYFTGERHIPICDDINHITSRSSQLFDQ